METFINVRTGETREFGNGHYDQLDYIRSSDIRTVVNESLAHYRYKKDNPTPPTKDMQLGTALHSYLLEPSAFYEKTAVYDERERPEPTMTFGSKKNKEWKEQFERDNSSKTILSLSDYDTVKRMASSILLDSGIDLEGEKEVCLVDPELCTKSRPDIFTSSPNDWIIDIKTTNDASPEAFSRTIIEYGYHIQAAHYISMLKQLDGIHREFYIIAVEKKEPFVCQTYILSPATIAQGMDELQWGYNVLKEAKETGAYYGYSKHLEEMNLPKWSMGRLEELKRRIR